MTITTSRGKTFPADWAWGQGQELRLQMADPRPLSEIAADFEGCERFQRQSDTEGDLVFDGYTRLTGALRQPSGSVQLILARPEGSAATKVAGARDQQPVAIAAQAREPVSATSESDGLPSPSVASAEVHPR